MMDPTEVKKSKDCDVGCECKDCVMRLSNDDESIFVTVSPRTFDLPKGTEKSTKMKIKNENSYPIYFKASTSNTDVFRPRPDNGLIPPKSKVSLDVQFRNSAVPLRRHEEVIVFTSIKPFDKNGKGRLCPFCLESFDVSKNHVQKAHSHTYECSPTPENGGCKTNGKRFSDKAKYENNASYYDDFEIKYKPRSVIKSPSDSKGPSGYKAPLRSEYESKHLEREQTKKMQEGYNNAIIDKASYDAQRHTSDSKIPRVHKDSSRPEYEFKHQQREGAKKMQEKYDKKKIDKVSDDAQTQPKMLLSYEKVSRIKDYDEEKTKQVDGSKDKCIHIGPNLCIHTPAHQTPASGCSCTNCIDLWTGKEGGKIPEVYLISEKQKEFRMKSDEHIADKRSTIEIKREKNGAKDEMKPEERRAKYEMKREEKGTNGEIRREEKSAKDEIKEASSQPHILTRVVSAEAGMESLSDTVLWKVRSEVKRTRHARIISEEDYKRKKEKIRKKLLKQDVEESESTTTEDTESRKEKLEKEIHQKDKKSAFEISDEKYNNLIRMSWANLLFILLLVFIVVGGFGIVLRYCCSAGSLKESYLPCIYDIYRHFR